MFCVSFIARFWVRGLLLRWYGVLICVVFVSGVWVLFGIVFGFYLGVSV